MARKKPGPKPNPNRVRSAVVSIRSRPEWKEWLEEFAKYSEQDLSNLIDDALQQHARTRKFKVPPRR
jgi:predicted transcriptional regulator